MQEEFEVLIKRKISEARAKKAKREEIQKLIDENANTLIPDISDIVIMPTIYRWCCEVLKDDNQADKRKKSLFIIMLLYAPGVLLLKDRIPNYFRKELSKIYHCSPCVISNNISNIMVLFSRYKDFREDIKNLYMDIIDKLNECEGN